MRRATITTTHGTTERAAQVAAAVRPDNTAEMETTVDGETVRTVIERETTGGLHSTVDDYVVNLRVAADLSAADADADTDTVADTDTAADAESDADADSDTDTDTHQS